jgi:hypothetical protein
LYHVDPVLEGADGEGDEGEEVRVRKGDSADVAYRQRCTNSKTAIEGLDWSQGSRKEWKEEQNKGWREKWGKKAVVTESIEQGRS